MNIVKIVKKYGFKILSVVLILCSCDQLYMWMKYRNITTETFVLTLVLTALCMYFGFWNKSNKNI